MSLFKKATKVQDTPGGEAAAEETKGGADAKNEDGKADSKKGDGSST